MEPLVQSIDEVELFAKQVSTEGTNLAKLVVLHCTDRSLSVPRLDRRFFIHCMMACTRYVAVCELQILWMKHHVWKSINKALERLGDTSEQT